MSIIPPAPAKGVAAVGVEATKAACSEFAGKDKDAYIEGEDQKLLSKQKPKQNEANTEPEASEGTLGNTKQSQNDSVSNMSHAKRLPELPPLPASASAAPSELYQYIWWNYTSYRSAFVFKIESHSAENMVCAGRSTPTLLNSWDPISLCALAHMPELRVIHYTDNQPLTPEEQFVVMHLHEKEISKREKPPSKNDIERYCYYIYNGVQEDMLAPQDKEVMNVILKHIPTHILANPNLENLLASLKEEIQADYRISLMKAIVDYILMDPAERERLFIGSTPRPFPQRVVRAPVPWHSSYEEVKSWNERNLFIVNPLMPTLQQLWLSQYSHLRFVRTEEMLCRDLPLLPTEFEEVIRRHCVEARNILQNKWIPTCACIFLDQKRKWLHFAPENDCDSSQQVESYFHSVATLMSLQLREMVVNSLEDLLAFFMIHKDGSDFTEPYQEMQFFVPQILTVKLSVEEPKIVFEPPLKECWDLINHCFREILQSAEELPKVERFLFPELKRDDLTLSTVKPDESLFSEYVNKLEKSFESNILGPQKYLKRYRKYSNLLNNNAQQDVTDFLKEGHTLEALTEKIDSLTKLKREIASMPVTVPLAMFCLDAVQLNEELCNRTQNLKDRLIEFEVMENRELNK
ncbi:PREDICTED: dynein heavy chain 3, axonemal-like, partial [Fulmarus glacialis]|uniref:dynein heavy chain 3, axonemal-like n=1 Tax=Fulmarus glacialis TaxID=30455 RepID=UPI00051AF932